MERASAVIPTYNVADTIGPAIESVTWCDEILVVDSFSTDGTREIAESYGARVVDDPTPEEELPADAYRKIGVDRARHDVVVCLDADERHPDSLQRRLREMLADGEASGTMVRAPRLNYYRGEPLRGAGLWPDYTPVMLDRTAVRVMPRCHVWWDAADATTVDLPAEDRLAIHHEFVDSLWEDWRAQRRYARLASKDREFKPLTLLLGFPWGFYTRYVEGEGWKEGLTGLGFSLNWGWFVFETQVRAGLRELGLG